MTLEAIDAALRDRADHLGYEIRIVGSISKEYDDDGNYVGLDDGRLLKVCPKGVRTRVMLELAENDRRQVYIYKHRDSELTAEFKGRVVSLAWVEGFLNANKELAAATSAAARAAEEAQNSIPSLPVKSPPVTELTECPDCHGEGRWYAGSLRAGETWLEVCEQCRGRGYLENPLP